MPVLTNGRGTIKEGSKEREYGEYEYRIFKPVEITIKRRKRKD
jgi:hypothetical protein